jgi:hypothetical protein
MEHTVDTSTTTEHSHPLKMSTETSTCTKHTTSFADDYVDPYKLDQLLDSLFGSEKYSLKWRQDKWIVRAKDHLTQGQINSVKI